MGIYAERAGTVITAFDLSLGVHVVGAAVRKPQIPGAPISHRISGRIETEAYPATYSGVCTKTHAHKPSPSLIHHLDLESLKDPFKPLQGLSVKQQGSCCTSLPFSLYCRWHCIRIMLTMTNAVFLAN